MEIKFDILFANALTYMIENNGGSIEEALNYVGITEENEMNQIKEWFGWKKGE